ncbi:GtrA family protein [Cyanobacterium stanieri LEGE 03274]|uniref:GtrA family protein n=2 Tax=Cyanobacterium stanieri TaxID=102235 RepID=K9YPM0_CYASC|nr:GtrA family protein [Cyanobacterium stanieri]AFZ48412.1 GtrA family protein [Cyanobacterium stanieri PCC 7202]MBE9222218.1 GtrA family protein [Cyanobacterium stanieri LEGE 03274]
MIKIILSLIDIKVFKFLFIGGFCALLTLALMYFLTSILLINYLISAVITILVTNYIGFFLNKVFTFQTDKKLFWRELWKYYGVMLSSNMINLCIIYTLVDIIRIWYLYANMISIVALTPVNYLLHKYWSFKKKS